MFANPSRLMAVAAVAALLAGSVSGCFLDGRSAAAVCKVWNTDGRALHDQFAHPNVKTPDDLPGALANVVGAPGRVADLLDKMADVAPSDVEPSFKALANAFRQVAAGVGSGDPLGALAGGLAAGANAESAYQTVNAFLATNCGVPSQ